MQIILLALSAFACLSTFTLAAPPYSVDKPQADAAPPRATTPAPTAAEQKIKNIMQSPDVQNIVEHFINVVIAEFQNGSP